MIVGRGGGTTGAEVGGLEITSCGIRDRAFLSPYLNQLSGTPGRGSKGESERYGVRDFLNFPVVCRFFLIVVIPIVGTHVGFALAIARILASDGASS